MAQAETPTTSATPTGRECVRPSLAVNAFSNWAVLAVNGVTGFFLTPYIIAQLGREDYGILTLVASVVGYYGLLELGVQSAVMRYVAYYAGQRDARALSETVSTALAIFLLPATAGVALSFLLSGWFAGFFHVAPANVREFEHAMWLFGITFGVSLIGSVFRVTVVAYERYVLANVIGTAQTLVRTAITVLILSGGAGLVGVIAANLATAAAASVVMAFWVFRIDRGIVLSWRLISRRAAWTLIGFGTSSALIGVADVLRFRLDSLVIGRWVDVAAVGVYGLAVGLVSHGPSLVGSATGVLLPRFSKLAASEDGKGACQALLVRSMGYSAMLSYGLLVSAAACGRAFIERWVGPDFAGAYPIMIVLMSGYVLSLAQTPGLHYLRAANKHHFFAAAAIVEGLVNLALSIALVLRYGSIGVAIGTMVPMVIAKTLVQPVYTARLAAMPLSRYWKAIGAPMPAAAVLVVLAWLYPLPTTASWLAVCAVGAGAYAAFIAIVMFTVMSGVERRWAYGTVVSILRLKTAASRS